MSDILPPPLPKPVNEPARPNAPTTPANYPSARVDAMKPIEALAEMLPQKHWDALRSIHQAGNNKRWDDQMQLLDGLRREISSDRADPKNAGPQRDRLTQSIQLIDAERANAKDRAAGLKPATLNAMPGDPSLMPPPMVKALDELRHRATVLDPKMAHEAALYINRVQLSAKQGAFDLVQRYSERFVEAARESHRNAPQPLLGPVASKANEIAKIAQDIDRQSKLGMQVENAVASKATASTEQTQQLRGPAPTGSFLLDALRGNHAPEQARKSTFRPH